MRTSSRELRCSWTVGQYSYITPLWGMDDPSTSGVTEGFGLMFYNARWLRSVPETQWRGYDPSLGRFAQADTIVPGGVQGLDRYAYVNNGPTRFADPSGHTSCEGPNGAECDRSYSTPTSLGQLRAKLRSYGVALIGNWKSKDNEQWAVFFGVELVGTQFAYRRGLGESSSDAFKNVFDHIDIKWEYGAGTCGASTDVTTGGCTNNANYIRFWSLSGHGQGDINRMTKNVVHELGHAYNASIGYGPSTDLDNNRKDLRLDRHLFLRPNPESPRRYDWQQHPPAMDEAGWSGTETFGDMFIAWAYDAWNTSSAVENVTAVSVAQTWMSNWLP